MAVLTFCAKHYKFVIVCGLLVIIVLLWFRVRHLDAEAIKQRSAYLFLTDSIKTIKTKNHNLAFERSALITDVSSLKKVNDSLYRMASDIKGTQIITRIVGIIDTVRDTTFNEVIVTALPTGDTAVVSHYHDSSISFTYGHILQPDGHNGFVTSLSAQLDLSVGIRSEQGISKAFVTFKDDRFKPVVIDGIILDDRPLVKKKTLNSIGLIGGYGVNYTPGGNISHGVQLGIGYSFGIVNW